MGIRKSRVKAMYEAAKANQEACEKTGGRATKETDAAYDRFKVLEIDATPEEREMFRKLWE